MLAEEQVVQRDNEVTGAGIITDILLLVNRETPSFLDKLDKNGYFRQFPGKAVNEPFQLETDVDAISGSTISSARRRGGI